MIDRISLTEELKRWVDNPETIMNLVDKHTIHPGQEVYVITRWSRLDPYELVKGTIMTERYSKRTGVVHMSVEGKYSNGHYYGGTFRESSINKTVYLHIEDAHTALNNKLKKVK